MRLDLGHIVFSSMVTEVEKYLLVSGFYFNEAWLFLPININNVGYARSPFGDLTAIIN